MFRLMMTAALIGGSLTLTACNTVRGAASDLNSAANCTEELMNQGRC